jgi:serine/threonine-protein kinase
MSGTNDASDDAPTSIGRYQITGTLGFGAMGAVYRAFDPIIKRELAIKTIRLDVPPQSPQYATFKERFYQEVRISGNLSHPNIVTLFDVGEEKNVPFLTMEYVEGRALSDLLDEGVRFEPERVLAVASQVASALDYAHSKGVVHRDIKPSNLIVQVGDKVKVTDFGIAKLVDEGITQTGALLGTPSYMSPEQAMGEPLDGRSDIFSLGVCCFEMLSGEQPFPGNNVTSILYRLVHVDPIEPAELEMRGVVPRRWREVFHRVLAKKPDGRFQKAGDFVHGLESCLGTFFSGIGDETTAAVATPHESTVTLEAPRPEDLSASAETSAEPEPEGQPDTVVLPSGVEGPSSVDSATVRMEAPGTAPGDSETVALSTEAAADSATVVLPTDEGPGEVGTTAAPPAGTSEAPGPTVVLESLPPEALPPEAATMPPPPVDAGPPGPGRPLPAGWLLGGAAGLFAIAVAVVGWMLWTRGGGVGPSAEATPTASPTAVASATPTTGTVLVESEPPGAQVTLDGEDRGQTPLELAEVAFGDHEVGLALKGYEEQSLDVSLSAETPTAELHAELARRQPTSTSGTVRFVSVPPGAAVFVDGRRIGITPLDGVRLKAGDHDVSFTLDDHDRWAGQVRVAAGRRLNVERELSPSAPETPPPPPPVDTTRIYENKRGDVDVPARRKSGLSPSYPRRLLGRLKSGQRVSCAFTYIVTEEGTVEDVKVTESAGPAVDDAVVKAIEKWKFEPATIRGTPVKVRVSGKQTFLGG